MKKTRKRASSDEQLIEVLEERLHWYMEEAPAEEVDGEKVDEIVRHLNMLKNVQTVKMKSDEEALAQFHAYVGLRERERAAEAAVEKKAADREKADKAAEITAEATEIGRKVAAIDMAVIAGDANIAETLSGKKKNKGIGILFKTRSRKFAAAAAAVLLVALAAGGSMGATNANQGNGFFYWLQRDDEGVTMITSPENMDGKLEVQGPTECYSLNEIPEEYRQYLVYQNEIGELQDYYLKKVSITKSEAYSVIREWFVADDFSEKNIFLGVFIYPDELSLSREVLLSQDVQNIEEGAEIEAGVLLRENPQGEKEGKIFFFLQNKKYCIEGNVEA